MLLSTRIRAGRLWRLWSWKGTGPALSHYQASQLLGLSRIAFDGFLKERGIHEHAYSVNDLKEDEETLRQLESKDRSRR